MKPKSLLALIFALLLLLHLPLTAGAAPDTTKLADIANMKAIGAALTAYKKAKGEFPDHLSDLVPKFLDAKTLVSPLGEKADSQAAKGKNDPQLPCSYEYEFSTDTVHDFARGDSTRRAINRFTLDEYGSTTPILRCFLYEQALNLSHSGDIFNSDDDWVFSDEIAALLKKNGYGPGMKTGKKLLVHLTAEAGQPVAGVALSVSDRESSGRALVNRDFTSDAKGDMTIPLGTDPDAEVTFRCLQNSWFLAERHWTWGDEGTPPKGDLATVTAALQPAAPIGGIVRDAQGHPLQRVVVYFGKPVANPDPEENPNDIDTSSGMATDANGRWELPSFPRNFAGLKIYFRHAGSREVQGAPGEHGVPDAAALFAKTAELSLPPPFLVKGTVLSQGQPLPGATVCLMALADGDQGRSQATTDAHGHFEIPAVGEATSAFVVIADHLAPFYKRVKLAADGPAYELTLESGQPAKARLVDSKHRALPDATVLFNGFPAFAGQQPLTQPVIGVTDAAGRFTWDHAPKVPVLLKALLPSGETQSVTWDLSKPGEAELRTN